MKTDLVSLVELPESLVVPRYGFAEADRLARVSPGTSRRWLAGYSYTTEAGKSVRKPPVGNASAPPRGEVSFVDLVEVAAIRGLRDLGLSLPQVRKIVANCAEWFGAERPLLALRFKANGHDAFVQQDGVLFNVLQNPKGSVAWDEVLGPFLETIDYQDGWAQRWWPLGHSTRVVIDPQFGYGLPVIAGTGVRTEILLERIEAGDSHAQISVDFSVPLDSIQDALTFEHSLIR